MENRVLPPDVRNDLILTATMLVLLLVAVLLIANLIGAIHLSG